MSFRPLFHRQETVSSCVPACLRMVLTGFDLTVSEEKLRQLCDCTIFGTDAFQAVKAARQLGFSATRKINADMAQLNYFTRQKLYPIAYIQMMPISQLQSIHAVVVTDIRKDAVDVLDPLTGDRNIEKTLFEKAFSLTNSLTIIVAKDSSVFQ